MKKALYIVPGSSFFNERWGGRTAHVLGIVEGLSGLMSLTVLGGTGMNSLIGQACGSIEFKKFVNLREITFLLKNYNRYSFILVRKNFLFMCLTLFCPKRIRKELIWEVNGLSNWGDSNINGKLEQLVFLLHKLALHGAKGIYVVTPELKRKLINIGLPECKIIVIPNGVPSRSLSLKWSKTSKYSLLFFGVLRQYNDWDLINVFLVKNPDITLNIFGYHLGNDDLTLDLTKKNLFLHGKSSPEDVLNYISNVSENIIGIVPMKDVEDSRMGSPIKLYDYLSFGVPVLVSSSTYLDKELEFSSFIGTYNAVNAEESFELELQRLINVMDSLNDENGRTELSRIQKGLSWKSRMELLIDQID